MSDKSEHGSNQADFNQLQEQFYQVNNHLASKEKEIKDLTDQNTILKTKLEGGNNNKGDGENDCMQFVIEERNENDKGNYDANIDFNNLYED